MEVKYYNTQTIDSKKHMRDIIKYYLARIRYLFWKGKFGKTDGFVHIGKHVTFQNPQSLYFGKGISIGKYAYFLPCTKYAGVSYNPKIEIGDGCIVGIRNSFAAINSIKIGKNVLFAGYVHLTDHSHGYEDIDRPVTPQQLVSKGPIVVEDDCWLGFGCEILSGVHIGKHCVVAARSVVTKDVPSYSIVAGNPAHVIKVYNFEKEKWEKV